MSMGWMMHVASMPDRPPFTKGLAAFHAAGGWLCAVAICAGREEGMRARRRQQQRRRRQACDDVLGCAGRRGGGRVDGGQACRCTPHACTPAEHHQGFSSGCARIYTRPRRLRRTSPQQRGGFGPPISGIDRSPSKTTTAGRLAAPPPGRSAGRSCAICERTFYTCGKTAQPLRQRAGPPAASAAPAGTQQAHATNRPSSPAPRRTPTTQAPPRRRHPNGRACPSHATRTR